ncbi:unnamed protein product [Vitrella brassicaformis CCMP3155]|uniref:L-lactate permease n=1 Tax=Vitrella brassicaformis (strain CCMP3155) TaxID=1169540 RepID=A0A0G4G4J3_VITBC|nr:unnamed protein product [Vitrella brassicaformis CCMP3155]|eukprot:CEM23179.1 unnamed protein product [Vitrella brassicaformis CCMP3155]
MANSPAAQTVFYLAPIAFLLATLKPWGKHGVPSQKSLPISALLLYLIRLVLMRGIDYDTPNVLHAAIVSGLLDVMTPVSIIFGAILLFRTMSETQCMSWVVAMLHDLSSQHPVAEVMLIGWGFGYIVEGASGFGTPVALAAPILAELGHDPIKSVVCCLIMNGIPNPFGAVGTPVWFGFSAVAGHGDTYFPVIAQKTQTLVLVCTLVVPFTAVMVLVPPKVCLRNAGFIVLSCLACGVPSYALTWAPNPLFEFASLIGGIVGFALIMVLIYNRVLLFPDHPPKSASSCRPPGGLRQCDLRPAMVIRRANSVDKLSQETTSTNDDWVIEAPPAEVTPGPTMDTAYGPLQTYGMEVAIVMTRDQPVQCDSMGPHQHGWVLFGRPEIARMMSDAEGALPCEPSLVSIGRVEARKTMWGRLFVAAENTFPIWGCVVLLILTRVRGIGLKQALTAEEPYAEVSLGRLGAFRVSASLSLFLRDILAQPGIHWRFQTLYVPAVIPFVVISLLTMALHRNRLQASPLAIFAQTAARLRGPIIALAGAMALVNLLRRSSEGLVSPATKIGGTLSRGLGVGWVVVAPVLGALGSFFSGSTTVSNLTFGDIQRVAAEQLGFSVSSFLALQCMGGALGNMICIHNILAAKTVLGLDVPEGEFIKKTAVPAAVYYMLGLALGAALIFTTAWWGAID